MKPKMSLVTLGVNDLARSRTFYEKGLGLPAHGDGEGVVFFELEGTWLSLFPRKELAKDANVSEKGSGFSGVTLAHNVDSEAKVDEVFALALRAGATEVLKPEKAFWGGYRGYFADPDGHLWEVCFNPYIDLT